MVRDSSGPKWEEELSPCSTPAALCPSVSSRHVLASTCDGVFGHHEGSVDMVAGRNLFIMN